MSYYILPKNNNTIYIEPIIDLHDNYIYTSYSIYNYYQIAYEQMTKIITTDEDIFFNHFENLYKEFNPYEYIFSKVPGSKYSVSKLKTQSNLFYEFLEIVNTLNCFESFKNINLRLLHIGENYNDIIECFSLLRENKKDVLINQNDNLDIQERCDFIFYETNLYVNNLIYTF